MSTTTVPRLKAAYFDIVQDQLKADLGLDNIMQVPRLEKIVVNMGVGDAVDDLADEGLIERDVVRTAITEFGIDSGAPNPVTV